MIVVDANIIAYALLEGEHTPMAQQTWTRDPSRRAPVLWEHEFLNILASVGRRGTARFDDLNFLWARAHALLSAEQAVDPLDALRLAVNHRITAYDAQYIALAHKLGVLCVTEDKGLLKAFPRAALSMRAFCDRKP